MKIIITEQQNNRLMGLMKDFADEYKEEKVIRTEVEIEYLPEKDLYFLHPIFYVKSKINFPHHIYKHILAQRVEDMFGVPVHSSSVRLKVID
jgi:hypothetical protein